MLNKKQKFGKKSESLAASYLKKQGYKILELNYRSMLGEIDIIAKDKNTIVFVEVKARSSNLYGNPKYAVTPKKQKKISMVALYYLKTTNQNKISARFDVISISPFNQNSDIELIKNAFELAYG